MSSEAMTQSEELDGKIFVQLPNALQGREKRMKTSR
jgi:hypothetical protein